MALTHVKLLKNFVDLVTILLIKLIQESWSRKDTWFLASVWVTLIKSLCPYAPASSEWNHFCCVSFISLQCRLKTLLSFIPKCVIDTYWKLGCQTHTLNEASDTWETRKQMLPYWRFVCDFSRTVHFSQAKIPQSRLQITEVTSQLLEITTSNYLFCSGSFFSSVSWCAVSSTRTCPVMTDQIILSAGWNEAAHRCIIDFIVQAGAFLSKHVVMPSGFAIPFLSQFLLGLLVFRINNINTLIFSTLYFPKE